MPFENYLDKELYAVVKGTLVKCMKPYKRRPELAFDYQGMEKALTQAVNENSIISNILTKSYCGMTANPATGEFFVTLYNRNFVPVRDVKITLPV